MNRCIRAFFICQVVFLILLSITQVPQAESAQNQGTLIFSDNFQDNRNGWLTGSNRYVKASFRNGRYRIERKKIGGSFPMIPETKIPLNPDQDFRIEATMEFIDGKESTSAYGIVFGMSDSSSHHSLDVYANGDCRYSIWENGSLLDRPWQSDLYRAASSYVRRGKSVNKIGIQKSGNRIKLFLNNNEVFEIPFQLWYGNRLGLRAGFGTTVDVLDLTVTQFAPTISSSSPSDTRRKAETTALPPGASTASGSHEKPRKFLDKTRDWDKVIIYQENFQDNRNNWWTFSDINATATVENGRYRIERQDRKGNQSDFLPKITSFPLPDNRDFEIEATLKFIEGRDDQGYGIVWGRQDNDNKHYLWISAGGTCRYWIKERGDFLDPAWQQDFINSGGSSLVHKGQSVNKLSVQRKGERLYFSLNGKTFTDTPFVPLFGKEFGIYVGHGVTVEVSEFQIAVASPDLPASSMTIRGDFETFGLFGKKSSRLEIFAGSEVVLSSRRDGKNVAVSAKFESVREGEADTGSIGVFLRTEDDAVLRLVKSETALDARIRLSASAAGNDFGQKEIEVSPGEMTLRIIRQGDQFRGEVVTAGQTLEVGRLNWPNLQPRQEVGIVAEHKTSDSETGLVGHEFSEFLIK